MKELEKSSGRDVRMTRKELQQIMDKAAEIGEAEQWMSYFTNSIESEKAFAAVQEYLLQEEERMNAMGLGPMELRELVRQNQRQAIRKTHFRKPNRTTEGFEVATMHKKVADKIRPVDEPRVSTEQELGNPQWRAAAIERQMLRESLRGPDIGPMDHLFESRHASFPRGQRLDPERMRSIHFGNQLSPQEVDMFKQMLLNREAAIAFTFRESGRIHPEVSPPYKIHTKPHTAWQANSFKPPKSAEQEVLKMLKERIDKLVLEQCDSQYRNSWFLVAKKDGGHRLIMNAIKYNAVTIRDAALPPCADDFSEYYAGCKILTLVDFFSGYDQMLLAKESRDMTAFQTMLGLLRCCTLPMGATNAPAAFLRVILLMLSERYPHDCRPFIDDVCCGGSKDDYGGKEALPGIRQFVLEHAQQVDRVLADIERAGSAVSGKKCYFGWDRIEVVGYEVDAEGRHPQLKKIEKIVNWPAPRNPKEVRMFVGIVVYYRIWIFCFALVAKPLFQLMRKDIEFAWTHEHQEAMDKLKTAITTAPALVTLDYSEGHGEIILGTDGSGDGAGCLLEQVGRDGLRHPVRYESCLWSADERKWHSTKLECRALLWALKKCRYYLYGVHFVVETDAQTLIAQLNRTSSETPGSLMNRWLAAIMMWDFDIRHVKGKKNVIPDALSRMPQDDDFEPPMEPDDDLEAFLDHTLSEHVAVEINGAFLAAAGERTEAAGRYLDEWYSEESEQIAQYLTTLRTPRGMDPRKARAWRKNALTFFAKDGHLFKKSSRNMAIRRVVDHPSLRVLLIWEIHRQIGHRGINAVATVIAQRYHWRNIWEDTKRTLRQCESCQMLDTKRTKDMMINSRTFALWEHVYVDVVHMPREGAFRYLVVAREALSGWPEARALKRNNAHAIAKFLYEDIICRWSMVRQISVDGGPEFGDVARMLLEVYKIRRLQSSAYNPQAMGMIESGHKPIKKALASLSGKWTDNLPTVLMADRCSVHEPTGYAPLQLVTGQNPILPVEMEIPTWQTLPFGRVRTRADLLAIRAAQLDLRDRHMKLATARTMRLRARKKEYWDATQEIEHDNYKKGDLVLLWNSQQNDFDRSTNKKLSKKWLGPYKIHDVNPDRNYYRLAELDGVPFRNPTPGYRIKRFVQRDPENVAREDLARTLLNKEGDAAASSDEDADGPLFEDEELPEDIQAQQLRETSEGLQYREVDPGYVHRTTVRVMIPDRRAQVAHAILVATTEPRLGFLPSYFHPRG
ncbi:unnamed protein product [Periconia digitata]|uniref:Integrase catalytic domain-containing protein n=1 Tax=Periconia digitata TaxID=1303443 RepID=A0A9W4UUF6_9PLEO|nr:unnamed protein product [Periconia digitata]